MRGKILITFLVLVILAGSIACVADDSDDLLMMVMPAILASQRGPQISYSFTLPDTGQTKCYDMYGARQTPCPQVGGYFYGQDASYAGSQPAYEASGNATVTDLNTALIWQQTTGSRRTWQQAMSYCSALTIDNANDWRLPSKFELQSIVHYGRTQPASNPIFSSKSSGYWSATPQANTTLAWTVFFDYGHDFREIKAAKHFVRCVRN